MKNGVFYANAYEHDEHGHVTDACEGRIAMAAKRMKKFEAMKKDMRAPAVYGDEKADITFVSWGSSRGPVFDAMEILKEQRNFIASCPFYMDVSVPDRCSNQACLRSAKRIIDVEQNATGQLADLITAAHGNFDKRKNS